MLLYVRYDICIDTNRTLYIYCTNAQCRVDDCLNLCSTDANQTPRMDETRPPNWRWDLYLATDTRGSQRASKQFDVHGANRSKSIFWTVFLMTVRPPWVTTAWTRWVATTLVSWFCRHTLYTAAMRGTVRSVYPAVKTDRPVLSMYRAMCAQTAWLADDGVHPPFSVLQSV